jgi:hypothetical protein
MGLGSTFKRLGNLVAIKFWVLEESRVVVLVRVKDVLYTN